MCPQMLLALVSACAGAPGEPKNGRSMKASFRYWLALRYSSRRTHVGIPRLISLCSADHCRVQGDRGRRERASVPSMTMRLYSSMKSSMPRVWGSARAAITELQRPSSASVASCGFKSLRNSPEAMPFDEHPFDQALIVARERSDGVPRPIGQFVAMPDEDPDVVGLRARAQRHQMIGDGRAQLLGRREGARQDVAQMRDEILYAELADRGQRRFLRRKIIIETRRPDPEAVGDVFGAGAQIALLGERRRGDVQNFTVAAFPPGGRLPSGNGG